MKNFDEIFGRLFNKEKIVDGLDNLDYWDDEDHKTAIVTILVGSSNGIYIPQYVCEMFEIDECKDPDQEGYHDTFWDVERQLNDAMENYIIHDKYSLYFGYSESDGDYCLFATYEVDEDDEIDELDRPENEIDQLNELSSIDDWPTLIQEEDDE